MTRPQLVKMFNEKITKDNLKEDSQITFTKKVAKIFGKEDGYSFHAKDYHKFIAPYYQKLKSANA